MGGSKGMPDVVTGFEGFAIGQVFTSPPRVIEAAAIEAFGAAFDTQAQHLSETAAAGSIFGRLVASGWHTGAMTMRLMLDHAVAGIGGRSIGVRLQELTWPAPVHPGDALHAETTVTDIRPSRTKPDRGLVTFRTLTRNQTGAIVLDMVSTCLVLRSDAVINLQ
jgi:acyl dehydratase